MLARVYLADLFMAFISLLCLNYYSKSVGTTRPGFEFLIVKIVKDLKIDATAPRSLLPSSTLTALSEF